MSDQVAVYLDACCFIDVVKSDATTHLSQDAENEVWYLKRLMQAHRDREITLYTSTLSIAEAVHVGDTPVPEQVQNGFEALLTSGQYVHLIQTTPFICMDARNLRWIDQITLRGADSVHMASAIDRGCTEFLTMDGRFDRVQKWNPQLKAKGITVSLPSRTKSLPGKYLQGDLLDGETKH
jgi:predicted nucleic acid-binding protein